MIGAVLCVFVFLAPQVETSDYLVGDEVFEVSFIPRIA